MPDINALWYQPRWYHWILILILLPLTLLFAVVSGLRRQAYKRGLKPTVSVKAAVIVVGNISVGGNGKTPLVVFLAQSLLKQGYRPGILTRGFGGSSAVYPLRVDEHSQVTEVGDEPMLMSQHVDCPLVVDPMRARGAQYLSEQCDCDVIICDDGLQHYALNRDIEIVVMDGQRRTGNHLLLPAGPLREGQWRLQTVDFVVVNGQSAGAEEYSMQLQAGDLRNVRDAALHCEVSEFSKPFTAIAGIGNPERFFNLLNHLKLSVKQQQSFADHHAFSAADLPTGTVVMTEKDAVKCRQFAHPDCWYLPVEAVMSDTFLPDILSKLRLLNRHNN